MKTQPPVPRRYVCYRTPRPLSINGGLDDPAWKTAPWTEDFVDIEGDKGPRPRFRTRAKMLWDDQFFYVAADMEEPHVWAVSTVKNTRIYEFDNDFEVFIDPDGDRRHYYEFEMNALNTIWELTLPKPYSDGGTPIFGANLDGLKSAVHVRGTLNNPSDTDDGWSVEIAFPWAGLRQYNPGRATPPREGDVWRVNFSRVEWTFRIKYGRYVKVPVEEKREDNWVWSPQGLIDMHRPEHWGYVEFASL